MPGKKIVLDNNAILKQIWVANQFDEKGGGGASCGYHALKNAFLFIRSLHGILDAVTLRETVNSFAKIKTLFGPLEKEEVGTWRAITMQARAELAFKNYIYHRFGLKDLKNISEPATVQFKDDAYNLSANKIREIYSSLLGDYSLNAAKNLTQGRTERFVFDPSDVTRYIREKAFVKDPYDFLEKKPFESENNIDHERKDVGALSELIFAHLIDVATIHRYIDLAKMEEYTLTLDASKEVFAFYNKGNSNQLNEDGDWLQVEEMQKLHDEVENQETPKFIKENRPGLICNIPHGSTFIEDINDLTNTHGGNIDPKIFKELNLEDPLKAARDALHDETVQQYIHTFFINTADRVQCPRGHWLALVLYKHNGKQEYYIMDSINNTRLDDPRILKITNLLAQPEIPMQEVYASEKIIIE